MSVGTELLPLLEGPVIGGPFSCPAEAVAQAGPRHQALGPHLAALLSQLPPLQRSVLRLEGVSMRKAAERLGVAPATVQRARRQGLAGLRQGLGAHSHQSDSAP